MHNNKLAIIFPGQSSQHVGMLSDLSNHFTLVKETFSEASEVLGYDMWRLIQYGPINKLNLTYYAQPAVLIASVIIWKIWKKQSGTLPTVIAGHSLGEYSALVCTESIDLLSAVKLVAKRGTLMQHVVPCGHGAMSVIIGLDDNTVLEFCKSVQSEFNQIVAPSVFNAANNIVISGNKESVHKVNLLCKQAGAKCIILPISVPSHCDLMKPMIDEFQQELEKVTIRSPNIPIINNTDVDITKNPESIRVALIQQLYKPVRWREIIQRMINKEKINKFLEMGPGKVLIGLINYAGNPDIFGLSINDVHSLSVAMKKFVLIK